MIPKSDRGHYEELPCQSHACGPRPSSGHVIFPATWVVQSVQDFFPLCDPIMQSKTGTEFGRKIRVFFPCYFFSVASIISFVSVSLCSSSSVCHPPWSLFVCLSFHRLVLSISPLGSLFYLFVSLRLNWRVHTDFDLNVIV